MSFSNKEQGQYKEALLPRARDIDALVRAEHHDPFAILGPTAMAPVDSSFGLICRTP
jgi:hypothetical protein